VTEYIIQPRLNTAVGAAANNRVLAMGEKGYETDTKRWKTGDGATNWNDLGYDDDPEKIAGSTSTGRAVLTGDAAEGRTALGAVPQTAATAVLFGTSQEARAGAGVDNIVDSVTTWDVTTRGWWNWFASYSGHCLNLVHNAGVNGNTSTQMLARIDDDVIAHNPGWVFIGGPANDAPTGITTATTIANYTAIYEALRGRAKIVQLTMPPRTENDTTGEKTAYGEVNAWLVDAPTIFPHVETVDIAGLVADPSTGGPLADTLFDTVHYTEATANKIGYKVYQSIKGRLPSRPRHRLTIGHPANALSDPGMQSTVFTAPDVTTSTFTYVNDDETMGRRCRLVITGNTGGTQQHFVRCVENTSAGRWVPGSKVRAQMRVKFTDLQPVDLTTARRFHPILTMWTRHVDNTSYVTTDQALGLSSAEANKQIRGLPTSGEVVLRTPWRIIPANIDRIYIDAGWLGAVSGTIEMWEPVLEKEV